MWSLPYEIYQVVTENIMVVKDGDFASHMTEFVAAAWSSFVAMVKTIDCKSGRSHISFNKNEKVHYV